MYSKPGGLVPVFKCVGIANDSIGICGLERMHIDVMTIRWFLLLVMTLPERNSCQKRSIRVFVLWMEIVDFNHGPGQFFLSIGACSLLGYRRRNVSLLLM